MLINGQENIVKHGLYLKRMRQRVHLANKYEALLYIAVHCYVYYLAVREADNCISTDIRQSAINIWNDKDVKDSFLEFLNKIAETPEWLEPNILEQLHGIIDRFELFPQYESFKPTIITSVVSDFYLFLVLFISHEFYLPELLQRNIDDMSAFRYVANDNERRTKEIIKTLFKTVFIGNKTDTQIDVKVNLMYEDLEKTVKIKQKERYIKLAKEAQKNYKTNICEKDICEKIKKETIKNLKEKFAPILTESDEKNGVIRINLLTTIDYTDSLGTKNSIYGYHSDMNGMFLYGIVKFLYRRNV